MLFDDQGLPKDVGASDKMDSARLAGLMVLFDYMCEGIYLMKYVKYDSADGWVGMRHPTEVPSNNHKNFTRDQLVPLVAGLFHQGEAGTVRKLYDQAKLRDYRAQNTEADVAGSTKKFPNGADLLTPDVMNHLRNCSGQESKLLGRINLRISILFNSTFTPMREPNQLICLCVMAGPEYVRMFKKHNTKWREAIREYWCGWRGEPGLARHMIAVLELY